MDYFCYDCQRVTSGDCGKHGPRVLTTRTLHPSREDRLLDLLREAERALGQIEDGTEGVPEMNCEIAHKTAQEARARIREAIGEGT